MPTPSRRIDHENPADARIQENKDTRPTPDPTVLTTQQLIREISSMREILEARMDGTDKAILQLQRQVEHGRTEVQDKVGHLQELHEEKFKSIAIQFAERDTRTEQMSRDSKVAVDAALQAAKEAVGEQNKSSALAIAKSESATTKQIDQQAVLLQTATRAIDDKISDLKDRLTAIDGRTIGGDRTEKRIGDQWGYLVGGIGMIVAVITLIILVVNVRH
jgi:hypothetical protein